MTGYPALVDEGATVGVRVFETPQAAEAAQREGLRRLLLIHLPRLAPPQDLIFATADAGLLEDMHRAFLEPGELVWDAAGWRALLRRPRDWGRLTAGVADVLRAAADVRAMMERRGGEPMRETRLAVARQLGRLLRPGWVTDAGARRLPDIARYLRAAERRLERAPDALGQDRDRQATLDELEALDPDPWLLEELRASYFAPALARPGVSAKKVRTSAARSPSP